MTRLFAMTRFCPLVLAAGLLALQPVHAEVTATDAWARATVAGQSGTGAFLTLRSSAGGRLLSASSPAASQVEVHEMAMDNGVMRMRPVPSLTLPAGQDVKLAPGGYHIMLINLKAPLQAGSQLPLTLTVEEGGRQQTLNVTATVRALGQASAAQAHGADGHAHGHGHKH